MSAQQKPASDVAETPAEQTAATPVEDEAPEPAGEQGDVQDAAGTEADATEDENEAAGAVARDETADDAEADDADAEAAEAADDAEIDTADDTDDAEAADDAETDTADDADADADTDADAVAETADDAEDETAADADTEAPDEPEAGADAEPADGAEAESDEENEAAGADEQTADAASDTVRPAETETKSRRPRGAHARRVTPRQRLRALVAPQLNKTQAVIALACLVLGFGLSVQVQSTSSASSFSSLRQSELVSLLDRLTNRQDNLRREITQLQQEKAALYTENGDAARKAAQERQDTLGILAGTEPATGPGIELTITDPHTAINAADLLNAVEELRDSGAEVMQIGSVRIGTDSYFLDTEGGVIVDGQKLTPPYRLLAIGDPHTMGTAMNIPGGVLESLHRSGAEGTVRESESLSITAVREP
jgi:uncharacterized protein YlxW (UPF0749 family)